MKIEYLKKMEMDLIIGETDDIKFYPNPTKLSSQHISYNTK